MSRTVYMRSQAGEVFSTSHPEYHKDCENLGSGEKGYAARQAYAQVQLRKLIKPGSIVNCVLRSVSSSGMSRNISLFIVEGDTIRNIDHLASDCIGHKVADSGGIRVSGCGMDMGFHLVYSLGRSLFPEGFGTLGADLKGKKYRASTKRAAAAAVKRGYDFRGRNGDATGWDNDGGYALRHNWM